MCRRFPGLEHRRRTPARAEALERLDVFQRAARPPAAGLVLRRAHGVRQVGLVALVDAGPEGHAGPRRREAPAVRAQFEVRDERFRGLEAQGRRAAPAEQLHDEEPRPVRAGLGEAREQHVARVWRLPLDGGGELPAVEHDDDGRDGREERREDGDDGVGDGLPLRLLLLRARGEGHALLRLLRRGVLARGLRSVFGVVRRVVRLVFRRAVRYLVRRVLRRLFCVAHCVFGARRSVYSRVLRAPSLSNAIEVIVDALVDAMLRSLCVLLSNVCKAYAAPFLRMGWAPFLRYAISRSPRP